MRRRPKHERLQQEPKLLFRLRLVEAHDREHPLLDVSTMDTDRAAADLVAVADDVVSVSQNGARIAFQAVHQIRLGGGESMMHCGPRTGTNGHLTGGGGLVSRLK